MRRKLKSYAPSKLTNGQLYTSANQFLPAIEREMGEDAFVKSEVVPLKAALNQLKDAEMTPDKSPYTVKLGLCNEERNTALHGVVGLIEAFGKVPARPRQQQAARFLQQITDKDCQGLDRQSYENETFAIAAFLNEMAQPQAVVAIEEVGLQDLFEDLRIKHTSFESTLAEKMSVESQAVYPLTAQARQDAIYHLNGLLNYVDNQAFAKPEALKALVYELNDAIVYVMAKVRVRQNGDSEQAQPPATS
jgi:hypothetical protein